MTHIADTDKSRLSKPNLIGYRRCAAQAYAALAQGRGEEYDYVCRHATSWLSAGINPRDAVAAYQQSLAGFVPPSVPAPVAESLRRDAAHMADVYLHMSIWEQLEMEYGPGKGSATLGPAAGVVCLVAWLRWSDRISNAQ